MVISIPTDLILLHGRGGGSFADAFGEDFLGLRELGIAEEFGMSSLTIPKKLLKGKNKGQIKSSSAAYVFNQPLLLFFRLNLIVVVTQCSIDGTSFAVPSSSCLCSTRLKECRSPNRSPQALLPGTPVFASSRCFCSHGLIHASTFAIINFAHW